MFPAAIPQALKKGAPVWKLIENAPIAIPGHSRPPNSMSAAREMPVGGHTRVANPLTASIPSPNLAVTK
ncbi:MAG: hypothetical protein A3I06_13590 [Candidatus Lindowbacteria bacterium RIFCSPLOWO2_02_FULL_62_12]|nr:MAG: hypothetical protein A3I06_13590 [Candidatus Lindowbacteria bacterium RIFCSPLOWO2_02_FULL_62_12]